MRRLIALGVGLSAIVAVSCSATVPSVGETHAFDVDGTAAAAPSASQPTSIDIEATIAAAVEATQSAIFEVSAAAPTVAPAVSTPVPSPEPLPSPTAAPSAIQAPAPTSTPPPTPIPAPAASSAPTENSIVVQAPAPTATPLAESRAEMIERVRGSVVRISNDVASGSGTIVEVDEAAGAAYVLTSYGLVAGDSQINVTVNDVTQASVIGFDVFPASVVGFDAPRDLAVVRISCGTDLVPITFAGHNSVGLLDPVLAFGYPDESDSNSAQMAEGTVSGLVYDPALDRREIQTDATIDAGITGGPLVLITGEILGVNAFVITATPGPGPLVESGFAVSTDDLKSRYEAMRGGQSITSPTPPPDPRFPNGVYTSPLSGWQINVPEGWRLHETDSSRVDIWNGANRATVRVSLISVDQILYPDALFFREEWSVSPAPGWSNYAIVSESISLFRTKISDSKTVRGHEFQATFTFNGEPWLETTHWFVTDGIRYAVTLLAPAEVQALPENAEFDRDLRITQTSFHPL